MSALLDVNDLLDECTGPAPARRTPYAPSSKPTVLVATTSRSARNAITVALQSVGYHCLTAADAYALADALGRSTDVGLVVLDVRLPGFHPYQLCKTIRQTPGTAPAVVMLSPRAGPWVRLRAKWAGACGVVRKPVRPEDVIRFAQSHFAPV